MLHLTDYPWVLFLVALAIMIVCACLGYRWVRKHNGLPDGVSDTFGVVQAASLTMLGLIIGFTFSMAVSRYDQRKNYEEAEANAIGTEYVRIDLLDETVRPGIKALLSKYTDRRIAFYQTRSFDDIASIRAEQARIENDMWAAVVAAVKGQRDPLSSLAVAGMNDVLNSEGYSQAALWNRIPVSAWFLMILLGAFANLLVGLGAKNAKAMPTLLLIMPLFVAIAFAFIADIDSPRGGMIRVVPQNLISLADSIREPAK